MALTLTYGAVTLVNSGAASGTVVAPSCNAGDLLLIVVGYGGGSPVLGASGITGGAGGTWTELTGFPAGGAPTSSTAITIAQKTAAAGDSGATFTVNYNQANQKAVQWVITAADSGGGTPALGNSAGSTAASATALVTSSISVSLGSLVLAAFTNRGGTAETFTAGTWTGTATGLAGTERDDQVNTGSSQVAAQLQDGNAAVTGAGSVVATATASVAFAYSAGIAEIQPAPLTGAAAASQWPARPGLSRLRSHHGARRLQDQSLPQLPSLSVTAGLATGSGAAADWSAGLGTGLAPAAPAGTGTAQSPGLGLAGGSATSAGTSSGPGAELTPALAAGTGTAQPPGLGLAGGLATSAGASAGPGAGLTPGLAAGTGTAFDGQAFTPVFTAWQAARPGLSRLRHHQGARRQQVQQVFPPVPVIAPALIASGFGAWAQVPASAVILEVIAAVVQHGSNAQVTAPSYELWDGTTAIIGSPQPGTASTSASNIDYVVFTGVSYAQLATLQLRIYATSQAGNSGATVSVDAVSLSVEWAPNTDAAVLPDPLAVVPQFPAVSVSVGVVVTPGVLAVVPAFPAATAGLLTAAVFPDTLAVAPAFPPVAVSSGAAVTPGVLAVVPGLPPVSDVTVPNWATAQADGGWSNPGNVTGSPDGNFAVWVVP